MNEDLLLLGLEGLEIGKVVLKAVGNRAAPAVLHAFDDSGNVGGVVACVRVTDGTSFGNEVASNDSVQSGAMWVVLIAEFLPGAVVAVCVSTV